MVEDRTFEEIHTESIHYTGTYDQIIYTLQTSPHFASHLSTDGEAHLVYERSRLPIRDFSCCRWLLCFQSAVLAKILTGLVGVMLVSNRLRKDIRHLGLLRSQAGLSRGELHNHC